MKRRLVLLCGAGAVFISGVAFGVPASAPPLPIGEPAEVAPPVAANASESSPIGSDLDIMLRQYEAEEKSVRAELEQVEKERGEVEARVLARGRVYYKQVRAGLLPAGGGFDELVDHAAKVERTRLALTRDLERETTLDKRKTALLDRLARLKADRAPLEVHREAMAEARSALQQAEERKAAFGRAFESSTSPSDYVAIYGADPGPINDATVGGFASLFGHLPMPLAGRAEFRKIDKSVEHAPAVELIAPPGAVARAVAAGRVAFADRVDDDRITVILDHGDRFFTVYGNLVRTDAKVGENVSSLTVLGPVGSRKGEGPTLYFELRKSGQAVEPGPWLGL